jgi:MFS transporter, DHA1 family, tetracycline resistance protein
MSRRVDPTSQGKLQGAINSIRAISGMVGPLLFTQVFALAISPISRIYFPGAPYFLAGFLLLSSLTLAAYVTHADAPPAQQPAPAISSDSSST